MIIGPLGPLPDNQGLQAQTFQPGDQASTLHQEGVPGRGRNIQVTVLAMESPDMYRVQTDMGIAILVPGSSLVAT